MNSFTAIDYLNQHFTYTRPGWSIKFGTIGRDNYAEIYFDARIDTVDSSHPDTPWMVDASQIIDVDNLDEDDFDGLVAVAIAAIIRSEVHEVREFVLVNGKSPVHPHTQSGQDIWQQVVPIVCERLKYMDLGTPVDNNDDRV